MLGAVVGAVAFTSLGMLAFFPSLLLGGATDLLIGLTFLVASALGWWRTLRG